MIEEPTTHLNEDAIDDLLIGLGSDGSEIHLEACSACRAKVEAFQENVSAFKQASLAWAESKPAKVTIRPQKEKSGWAILSPAEWALVAAVFVFLGLPIWGHAPSQDSTLVAISDTADSEQQIAQDNDLLRSIDAALSDNEVPSVPEYLITDESPAHTKEQSTLRSQ